MEWFHHYCIGREGGGGKPLHPALLIYSIYENNVCVLTVVLTTSLSTRPFKIKFC